MRIEILESLERFNTDNIALLEVAQKVLYVYLKYRPDMTYISGMAYLVTMLLRNLKAKEYDSF